MPTVRRSAEPQVEAAPKRTETGNLRAGARGEAVEALQRQLEALGFELGAVDGAFGRRTTAAVKAFQAAHELTPSGVVNAKTLAALRKASARSAPTWKPEPRQPKAPPAASGDGLQSKADLKAAVKDITGALGAAVTGAKLSPLVGALGDGKANLSIPLKPGRYEMKGVGFTVRPGTTVTMQVEVKNGELVPARGNKGTQLSINPSLDLPLWVEGNGAKLVGDAAQQKLQLELGGFFDLKFKSTRLSELAQSLDTARKPAGGTGASAGAGVGSLLQRMLDVGGLTVDAKVKLRERSVDLGGVKASIDPDTTFRVTGTGTQLRVKGRVELDAVAIDQGGLQLKGTAGSADVEVAVARGRTTAVDTTLTNITLNVESLRSRQPSRAVPSKTNELTLGPTRITSGALTLPRRTSADGTTSLGAVEFDFAATGAIKSADVHVKDLNGGARFQAQGHFTGGIALSGGELKLDVDVKQGRLDVADLQRHIRGNALSISKARFEGDVKLRSDSGTGLLQLSGTATRLDVQLEDFKGGPAQATADLGRTTVKGGGTFSLGKDGFTAEGRLHGAATIDSARLNDGKGRSATVAPDSVITGDITRLSVGKGPAELRMEGIDADLKLRQATVAVGDATLTGDATVKGTGRLTLDAAGLDLQGQAVVRMTLDDGRVHASTVALDFAKGSSAQLNVTDLKLGKTMKVELAPGSRIDALLDSGAVTVDGTKVELEAGSRARFDVAKVNVEQGKPVELRGAVTLDGKLKANAVHPGALERLGVKLHPTAAQGRLQLEADDVRLSDGRLSFEGADVKLDAKLGRVLGARTPGSPGVGTLSPSPEVLSTDEVKATSPAALAGLPAQPLPPTPPLEALRLLQRGDVALKVPLSGGIHALGIEVLTFPPGTQLDLKLAVRDGAVVPQDTTVKLSGGANAVGVEVTGLRVTPERGLVADLRVFGRALSVPVPGVTLPANMQELADLAKPKPPRAEEPAPTGPLSGLKRLGQQVRQGVRERVDHLLSSATADATRALDLQRAALEVKDATFGEGSLVLPTGPVKLAAGSTLSFKGTPSAGELTGRLALAEATVSNGELALRGGTGSAELHVRYHREGNRAVAQSELRNLSAAAQALVAKQTNGDYLVLGQGQLSGVSVRARSTLQLDERGLPRTDVLPQVDDVSLEVERFQGDVQSGRLTSRSAQAPGTVELGATRLDGSLALGPAGLTLRGRADRLDGLVRGARLERDGLLVDVERARLKGGAGTVELGADLLRFDAKDLAYDVTFREIDAARGEGSVEAGRVRVTGSGTVSYDSATDLKLEGELHVEGALERGSAAMKVPVVPARSVVASRKTGVAVR